MNDSTAIVIPPDAKPPDPGIITSAYGPEEAGDLSDIVGHPPAVDDTADPGALTPDP